MSFRVIKYFLSILCIIVVTSALIISLEYAIPNYFSFDDNSDYYFPMFLFNWRSVVIHHTLPLINFHQFLGVAHLAQGQNAVFYLPNYLGVTLSQLLAGHPYYTVDILAYLHFASSAIATFFLLRGLKISHTISLLSALIWITFPYGVIVSRAWVTISFMMVYLPLNFLFLEKLFKQPSLRWALLLAITKTACFLARHPQHSFMFIIFDVIFLAILIAPKIDRGVIKPSFNIIKAYLLALLLFTFFIAPVLVPMIENSQSAARVSQVPYSEFIKNRVTLESFVDAQFFLWRGGAIYGASSVVFYFGFLNICIILLLAFKSIRKTARANYHTTTFLLLAIISFALSTSLMGYLYNIPLFGFFKGTHKYFQFFLFFSTLVIAGIAQTAINRKEPVKRVIIYLMLIITLCLNIGVVWRNKHNAYNSETMSLPVDFSTGEHVSKDGRIFTLKMNTQPDNSYQFLAYNYATMFDLYHFSGYSPFYSDLNSRLTWGVNHYNSYNYALNTDKLAYLSKWSVKYILTSDLYYASTLKQLRRIAVANGVGVYENTEAKPFAYNPDNPKQKIDFNFGVNHIDIYPNNITPHELRVSVAPLPRFYLFINDKKIGRISQQEDEPITIDVPINTHKVTIRYIDNLFIYGVIICLITILGLTGAKIYLDNKRNERLTS